MLKKYRRLIASLLLVVILSNIFAPTISLALTAGPTAPETTSFEPVDTTDMVNLATGDLVYNIPLLEVPGPAGGYPLSLAYHAGIQPDVEASWVGLGWNLNPGAINRSVDGLPDDYSGEYGGSRTFWEGGRSFSANIGVTVGEGNYTSATAGLSYSSDTYQGMSVGYGVNANLGKYTGSVGVVHSVSPHGVVSTERSSSIGSTISQVGLDIQSFASSVSSFSTIGSMAKAGAISGALGGVGLAFNTNSSKDGSVSSFGVGFQIDYPVMPGVSMQLGASYRRYWIDERDNRAAYGSLFFPDTILPNSEIDDRNFDITDLSYIEQKSLNPDDIDLVKNPARASGGTFPTYDQYNVTGQGISGSIRPYHLKGYLYRPTEFNESDQVIVRSYGLGVNNKPGFRFIGDFSNNFLYGPDDFTFNGGTTNPVSFDFNEDKITTGDGLIDGYENNQLAGSRSIKWFTNEEINSGSAKVQGLRECISQGFARPTAHPVVRSVGAIMITNESGVTYHYALPVYSRDEFVYTGRTDEVGVLYFNESNRRHAYAYTWLLTAVTGPDYVDKNNDGLANAGDYGYWVSFQYGRWTGIYNWYNWRNPATGYRKDVDHTFDSFSKGKKQLYYLNAIVTQTHTALFVKDLRKDGKGVYSPFKAAVKIDENIFGPDEVDEIDEGQFDGSDINEASASTLRLKSIYLFQNKDLSSGISEIAANPNGYSDLERGMGMNIVDVHDIQNPDFNQKAVRCINFQYDYSLTPFTVNTFYSSEDQIHAAPGEMQSGSGKLTLKSLSFLGKKCVEIMPEMKFVYESDDRQIATSATIVDVGYGLDDPAEKKRFTLRFPSQTLINDFIPGDIVKLTTNSSQWVYGVIISKQERFMSLYALEGQPNVNTHFTYIQKTKNPPYSKDHHDIWGFYKSDYVDYGHENVSRMVSDISSKSVDVWSLRKIKTVLGANINIKYGGDTYLNSIKQVVSHLIKDVQVHHKPQNLVKVFFYGKSAATTFKTGHFVKIHGILRRALSKFSAQRCCDSDNLYHWQVHHTAGNETITQVGENYIIVRDPTLVAFLTAEARRGQIECETFNFNDGQNPPIYDAINPYVFTGGELEYVTNSGSNSIGGGLRVIELSISDPFSSRKNITTYEYLGGVTSYEPMGLDVNIPRLSENISSCVRERETNAIHKYRREYLYRVTYKNFLHLLANSRVMPGPGVLYEKVKVRQSTFTSDGRLFTYPQYNVYSFQVFNPKLVDVYNKPYFATVVDNGYTSYIPLGDDLSVDGSVNGVVQGLNVKDVIFSGAALQDFSAVVGNLKSVATFDSEDRKIWETINEYLFDKIETFSFPAYRSSLAQFGSQGLIEEVFADAKFVKRDEGNDYDIKAVLSKYSQFPSIQVGSTSINYKTGVVQRTENLEFDFYSGHVTKSSSSDAFGNTYIEEVVPAFRVYPEMGLGIHGGKNMLSHETASYTYKADKNNNYSIIGLVGGTVQTWSDSIDVYREGSQFEIWRQHASYSFTGDNSVMTGDGLYPMSVFPSFNSWNKSDPVTTGWQKNGEVTLYDIYSHTLEATDINNNHAATKMSSDMSQVFVTAANARYAQFAYSGAEDNVVAGKYGGGVDKLNGQEVFKQSETDATTTHTGNKALRLTSTTHKAFRYAIAAEADKSYHASVWVNSTSGRLHFSVNGVEYPAVVPSENRKAGTWYLLTLDIPAQTAGASLEVWCAVNTNVACNFDDFRVHPAGATMTSYVYNQWGELSHILDNNNLFTEFRYDEMGRLKETYRETFTHGVKKVSAHKYHYANH